MNVQISSLLKNHNPCAGYAAGRYRAKTQPKMKHTILLIFLLICCFTVSYGQQSVGISITNSLQYADIKLYLANSITSADVKVYLTNSINTADKVVYFTSNKSNADYVLNLNPSFGSEDFSSYFCNNYGCGDLVLYFCNFLCGEKKIYITDSIRSADLKIYVGEDHNLTKKQLISLLIVMRII